MNRRMMLMAGVATLLPIPAPAQTAPGKPDLRTQLRLAAEGYRRRRANEPYDRWPARPAARPPLRDPQGPAVKLKSPDGRLALRVVATEQGPCWQLDRDGKELIAPSRLGFTFRGAQPLGAGLTITGEHRRSVDERWEQPWGEVRVVHDRFEELALDLREGVDGRMLRAEFRLFDGGLGFRIVYPDQPARPSAILEEQTEFVLPRPADSRLWWLPGWGFARDEYLYRSGSFDDVLATRDARAVLTPLTIETPGGWISIHEAALERYAGMNLAPLPGGILRADLVPWSDGDRVKIDGGFTTPWRAVLAADSAAALTESTLVLSLNAPQRYPVPWFRPGKYVGIWWGYIIGYWEREPGAAYGAATDRVLRYIDFAARNGFSLLIESWNKGWDGWRDKSGISFSKPSEAFDEARVLAHARRRGVPLVGHHETSGDVARYDSLRDEAFASLAKWHAPLVKTGYVAAQPGLIRRAPNGSTSREWHYGQFMVEHQQALTEYAAKRGIAILAHETVKDTGLRRTYPNLVSRECAVGQEFNGFDTVNGGTPPDHETHLVFTRLLAGPMDYTPGIFDLDLSSRKGERARIRREELPNVRPNSTLARQLALYVLIYSPVQMAADFIENYEGHRAFRFIRDVPVDWERSVGLAGYPGQFAATARKDRHSPDWYLGAITNGEGRTIDQPLDFLDPQTVYEAQIYADAPDSHFRTNPEAWKRLTRTVRRGDRLTFVLAPGGGVAVRFRARGHAVSASAT